MRKAEEEWDEFKKEMAGEEQDPQSNARALEFGDVLFTLVNVARLAGIYPESALLSATKKFENRFKHMEELARNNQTEFETLSFDEMHVLWDKAKKEIN
jgi:tetrapyrrole methylase family protein/MazG family protein